MSTQTLAPSATLPRLLLGVPAPAGAMSLPEHLSLHGEMPSVRPGSRREAPRLIDELEAAGLRGRGGGGFPTAAKLRAVAAARGGTERRLGSLRPARRPVVVVNAAEGEPASLKDQTLLEALPHLVLDGACLAAQALAADEVIVCVCEQAPGAQESVARAIRERRREADGRVRWHLQSLPGGYVSGQESALVSYLSGGAARPTFTPPMPFQRGVRGRPTLVSNAETFAHIALIARHGPAWFRELGTPAQPGSALLTLSGPLVHPGVYEAEHGSTLSSLIEAAGGVTEPIRAALVGGYAGTWIDARHLDALALSNDELAPYGATLGTGVVALLGHEACGLAETTRVARWLAAESAGQCGPCVHGLDALAGTLERALARQAEPDTHARLAHLISIARGRSACSHPDGAVRFVASALAVFEAELVDHMRHGPCSGCARPATLPTPGRRYATARGEVSVPLSAGAWRRSRRSPGTRAPSRARLAPERSGAGAS